MKVKGFENYLITEDGKIINSKTGRTLKPDIIWDGYERVTLCKNGVTIRFRVHRLVAEHFIPNDDPTRDQVNHKDGNRRKFMKKLKFYLLSFTIPLILLITVFLFRQVLTGKFSILTSDLFAQYYKLF